MIKNVEVAYYNALSQYFPREIEEDTKTNQDKFRTADPQVG
jgi:hypothetical protein